jgi:hypothetical protein
MSLINKKNYHYLFLILILADAVFSFFQHLHMPLDGDMAGVILPSEAYAPLMKDPFGMGVLLHDQVYASPNRFFAHWIMSGYYKTTPFLLQNFVSPLDSIYLSGAIAKIAIQIFLTWILARFISGSGKIFGKNFLLASLLIVPFFQTDGYNSLMGIIDRSVTYTFFYALPMGVLLTFLLPFYERYFLGKDVKWSLCLKVYLIVAAIFISFSCPIIPGIILILGLSIILVSWWNYFRGTAEKNHVKAFLSAIKKIPGMIMWTWLFVIFLSAYSIYLGGFSAENPHAAIPLADRYASLFQGLLKMITQKLGFPVIILFTIVNILLIKRKHSQSDFLLVRNLLIGFGLFTLAYLILLPLGGYREYRPNIIRRDTIMPVVLALFFLFSWTSDMVLKLTIMKRRRLYILLIAAILVFFTINDNPDFSQDDCERAALVQLQQSPEKITRLDNSCTVMSWHIMTDYHESEVRGQILKYWGVLEEEKYYYQ